MVLISPSNLNDSLAGCCTVGRQSFTFRTLNIFHSFLDLRDAIEKLSSPDTPVCVGESVFLPSGS